MIGGMLFVMKEPEAGRELIGPMASTGTVHGPAGRDELYIDLFAGGGFGVHR